MDIVAMVAIVLAATQVVKKVLTTVNPNIIAVVISVLVVLYKTIETGTPWNLSLIVVLIQVIVGSTGSFQVAKQLLRPKA